MSGARDSPWRPDAGRLTLSKSQTVGNMSIWLTKSLARELGPHIRVNAIAPGPVMWPERAMDEALKAEIIGKTALQRAGSPDDVARTALFFAVDAPYVTGQIIAVDGGRGL